MTERKEVELVKNSCDPDDFDLAHEAQLVLYNLVFSCVQSTHVVYARLGSLFGTVIGLVPH